MKTHKLKSGFTIEVLGNGLGKDTQFKATNCPWYLYNPDYIEKGHWMSNMEMRLMLTEINKIDIG